MYDATDNYSTADEIVAAVTHLQEQRDLLLDERDALLDERDGLQILLEDARAEELVIRSMDALPNGRPWIFVEDARILAISPDIDPDTEMRLLAQVKPPRLMTCEVCGAPMYTGTICRMH